MNFEGSNYFGSLGDPAGVSQGDITAFLDHSLIPRLGPAQKRSTITTLSQAKTYASAGFHVCVDRGLNERAGSNPRLAWADAAHSYWQAYNATTKEAALAKLVDADQRAANAPQAVRDAPPINPTPPAPSSQMVVPTPGGGQAVVPFVPDAQPAMMIAGIPFTMTTLAIGAALGGLILLNKGKWKKGKRGGGKKKRGGGRRGARGKRKSGGRRKRSSRRGRR